MIFIIQSPEKRDVSLLVFWIFFYFAQFMIKSLLNYLNSRIQEAM